MSVASDLYSQLYGSEYTCRQFGQATALGESEVVEVKVVLGQDDGDGGGTFTVSPLLRLHIDKLVGYGLEAHLGGELGEALNVETGVDTVVGGGEHAQVLDEVLAFDVADLVLGEGSRLADDAAECSHLLVEDHVVRLHEAVLAVIDVLYVVVELHAQQDDEHACEVGEEEPRELRYADVLPQ